MQISDQNLALKKLRYHGTHEPQKLQQCSVFLTQVDPEPCTDIPDVIPVAMWQSSSVCSDKGMLDRSSANNVPNQSVATGLLRTQPVDNSMEIVINDSITAEDLTTDPMFVALENCSSESKPTISITSTSTNTASTEIHRHTDDVPLSSVNLPVAVTSKEPILMEHLKCKLDVVVEPINIEAQMLSAKSIFEEVYAGKLQPKLPDNSWGTHKLSLPERVIIFSQVFSCSKDTWQGPRYTKQVLFYERMKFELYYSTKMLPQIEVSKIPYTLEDLEGVIMDFHHIPICMGGPPSTQYKSVYPKCAYKDATGKWRHNRCNLIMDRGYVCNECSALHRTLSRYVDRARKSRLRFLHSCSTENGTVRVVTRSARNQTQESSQTENNLHSIKRETGDSSDDFEEVSSVKTKENINNFCAKSRRKI